MGQTLIEQWTKSRVEHWLTSSWASSLSGVLLAMSPESAPSFEPHDPSPAAWAKWADPIWVEVDCGVAEGAVLRAGCARAGRSPCHETRDESEKERERSVTLRGGVRRSAFTTNPDLTWSFGRETTVWDYARRSERGPSNSLFSTSRSSSS